MPLCQISREDTPRANKETQRFRDSSLCLDPSGRGVRIEEIRQVTRRTSAFLIGLQSGERAFLITVNREALANAVPSASAEVTFA